MRIKAAAGTEVAILPEIGTIVGILLPPNTLTCFPNLTWALKNHKSDELLLQGGGASGPIDGIGGLREHSVGAPADTGGPEGA